jgi:hypothetical protein
MSTEVEGFEFLGSLGYYENWQWEELGVWKRGHQLFTDYQAGCSCNGPWEDTPDPSPATLDEVRRGARGFSKWEGRDAVEEFIREIEEAVK